MKDIYNYNVYPELNFKISLHPIDDILKLGDNTTCVWTICRHKLYHFTVQIQFYRDTLAE